MMDNPFDLPSNPTSTATAPIAPTPVEAPSAVDNAPNPFNSASPNNGGGVDFGFGGGSEPTVDFGFGNANPTPPTQTPSPFENGTQMSQFGNNNPNPGGSQKKKYKFIQLYWLINPKLLAGQNVGSESHIMEINYNADYSNLRLTFSAAKNDTFNKTCIKVQNVERLTTVNIYPETAEHVLFNIQNKIAGKIEMFERVVGGSSNWSPNQTVFNITTSPFEVGVYTQTANKQQYSYMFSGWQIMALIKALKFLTEGPAYTIEIARFLSND